MKCNFCRKECDKPHIVNDDETLQELNLCYECFMEIYGEEEIVSSYEIEYEINSHEVIFA